MGHIDTPPSEDPVARLKVGTDDLHLQLDRHSRMSRLVAADLTLQEYADVLASLLDCHREMEPGLENFRSSLSHAPDWLNPAIYLRSADLEADLRFLEQSGVTMGHTDGVPTPQTLQVRSLAEATGCMYVLAGSSLGARVIERRLREHLGDAVKPALRYFSPRAAQAGWGWSAYRQMLNAALQASDDEQAALKGARAVFGCFLRHMQPAAATETA